MSGFCYDRLNSRCATRQIPAVFHTLREHVQQKGNAAAVWLSAKGKHEVKLSGRQQEMLNQPLVGVRRMEMRIGFTHGKTLAQSPAEFTISQNSRSRQIFSLFWPVNRDGKSQNGKEVPKPNLKREI